jgi:hypothetical protein
MYTEESGRQQFSDVVGDATVERTSERTWMVSFEDGGGPPVDVAVLVSGSETAPALWVDPPNARHLLGDLHETVLHLGPAAPGGMVGRRVEARLTSGPNLDKRVDCGDCTTDDAGTVRLSYRGTKGVGSDAEFHRWLHGPAMMAGLVP